MHGLMTNEAEEFQSHWKGGEEAEARRKYDDQTDAPPYPKNEHFED